MKYINWNDLSELGLLERINKELLHPLGLAVSRTPDTGASEMILIADDGEWEYDPSVTLKPILSKEDIHKLIEAKELAKEAK